VDIAKALIELREQRDDVDQAILSLERLADGRPRGRGRPPGRTAGPAKKRPAMPGAGGGQGTKTAAD
jgi:hypothetical protein